MSLFCSISGQPPLKPVLSIKSGHVYERELVLKYLRDNDGKDPITGQQLTDEDLVEIKTAPGAPSAPPRPPTFTSVPALLHTLQSEWDATMLECLELRRAGEELRQELSHALYKEDAAMRVLARLTRERDEAREALASVKATLGPAFSSGAANGAGGDVEMEASNQASEAPEAGLPAEAAQIVQDTNKASVPRAGVPVPLSNVLIRYHWLSFCSLSATRRKRKAPADYATADAIKAYTTTTAIPSLHTTKPAGLSALALAKDASLIVTGGLDKAVQVYDRSTSKIVATLKGHTKKVSAVIASSTLTDAGLPTFLVSGSLDKAVRVWTPNGAKTVYGSTILATGGEVSGLSLHPSGRLVASASLDGSWAIHSLDGAKASTVLTGQLPVEGVSSTSIAFHPDGAIFGLGSSDGQIRIFDSVTGKIAATFDTTLGEAVVSLSFSENGYTLASASKGSNKVQIWDLRKQTNSANVELPEGEATLVNQVRFDPSAQYLTVVGNDLRVFANKTWEPVLVNEENTSEITGVEWSADGKEIATSSLDRSVRFLGTA
ncbi:BZ3500_MvSof-1268-A1-R1_Chr2-2g05112 [Microbotryum saponariae]|uniref:Pre-mRNA-processing factor 19 n=1 Tax=Microbotryum saponariae TaxID=289078 RepID=A0A2X0KAU5_9BASI|nr:BZ3500_MvSof-1268-A1-R1_Chr2-2g05112 [Microbotryum saponariae]SDA00939.1 BZ3501_MvSof-1269-A2-R1_Chr2-2g04786 [Microbotryum saponariae]